jgi:apolipoprotein D and lipocalin family protein
MGSWYVISSRPTFLEKDAFNAVETYTLLDNGVDIDIDFKFNKNSFDGPVKSIPQSGSVYNKETNSHWKVSPFWPLSFDYLIIATDPEHSWAAIGVPNQKYLWILARQATMNDEKLSSVLASLAADGYNVSDMKRVLHKSKD